VHTLYDRVRLLVAEQRVLSIVVICLLCRCGICRSLLMVSIDKTVYHFVAMKWILGLLVELELASLFHRRVWVVGSIT